MESEGDEDDLIMPGFLPAGQGGSLEDSSDGNDNEPPGLLNIARDEGLPDLITDNEDDDDDDGPPGLLPTDNKDADEYS